MALRAAGHLQTIKPLPLSSAVRGGFTIHDFQIDQHAGAVSCPAGYQTTRSPLVEERLIARLVAAVDLRRLLVLGLAHNDGA